MRRCLHWTKVETNQQLFVQFSSLIGGSARPPAAFGLVFSKAYRLLSLGVPRKLVLWRDPLKEKLHKLWKQQQRPLPPLKSPLNHPRSTNKFVCRRRSRITFFRWLGISIVLILARGNPWMFAICICATVPRNGSLPDIFKQGCVTTFQTFRWTHYLKNCAWQMEIILIWNWIWNIFLTWNKKLLKAYSWYNTTLMSC